MEIVSKVHKKVYSLCELDSALAFFASVVAASARQLTAGRVCVLCHRLFNEFYLEIKFWFYVWHETTAKKCHAKNVIQQNEQIVNTKMCQNVKVA